MTMSRASLVDGWSAGVPPAADMMSAFPGAIKKTESIMAFMLIVNNYAPDRCAAFTRAETGQKNDDA